MFEEGNAESAVGGEGGEADGVLGAGVPPECERGEEDEQQEGRGREEDSAGDWRHGDGLQADCTGRTGLVFGRGAAWRAAQRTRTGARVVVGREKERTWKIRSAGQVGPV